MLDDLKTAGTYAITPEMKKELQDFVGGYATEADTRQAIHETYADTGYVMDTHTAVASHVCNVYRQESGDSHKMVIASTASPYKFVRSVMTAIDENYASVDELELMEDLKKVSKTEIPKAIQDILDAQILHRRECDVDQMKATVREILKVEGK